MSRKMKRETFSEWRRIMEIMLVTADSVTFEIKEEGALYNTARTYRILLNGAFVKETDQVVNTLYGLEQDTDYYLSVEGSTSLEQPGCAADESLSFRTKKESVVFNVRDFGAAGDGVKNDTLAIQSAIMACPSYGRVVVPEGTYKISSIFLKSHLRMELQEGATLLATTVREEFPVLPGTVPMTGAGRPDADGRKPFNTEESDEYLLGTWEGDPQPMYAGIVTGLGVEDVVLYGAGTIDGNGAASDWWVDVKPLRVARRPRMLFLHQCKDVTIEGLTFTNSPAWVLHPYFSQHINFLNLHVINPADSPNTDGMDPESCTDMLVAGVHFSVGDDCIAIKSGKMYTGSNYKTPSERIVVRNCLMEDGHGAVTVGSEMAGGVKEFLVHDCMFRNTDRGLRIKTRRGRGKDAIVSNVIFERIRMDEVLTPLVMNSFYFCDADGHSEYVQTKTALPVDDRTPDIRELIFKDMVCTNCHVAASFFYGLPEKKIGLLSMENIKISFAENARPGKAAMLDGFGETCKLGLFANNIEKLIMKNVEITGQDGEKELIDNVDNLIRA